MVLVTQTQDTEARIKVGSSGDSIDTEGMKWIMNPYDEFAVEEAIKTKEAHGGEVILVTAGPQRAAQALLQGLAMGADSAVHISDESLADTVDSFVTSKLVASELKKIEGVDLIFTGMKIIDEESVQVGIQIAEELEIPHLALVSKVISIDPDGKKLVCQKEIDGGSVSVEVSLPALITCPDAMNEPRYASVPNIMRAKKKPMKTVSLDEVDFASVGLSKETVNKDGAKIKTVALEVPEVSRKMRIIKGSDDSTVKGDEIATAAQELAKLLREDAKVI